jgi:hypothetical protein
MEQRRRAKRERGSVAPEGALRKPVQLAIEEREQLVDGGGVRLVRSPNERIDVWLQIASVIAPRSACLRRMPACGGWYSIRSVPAAVRMWQTRDAPAGPTRSSARA